MNNFTTLTINLNGKSGEKEKVEARDLNKLTVAASRRHFIEQVIYVQQPTVVFAQEITTKIVWAQCIPNGNQKAISGSAAGVAWKKDTFTLIQEIDAGKKLRALEAIRGTSTLTFKTGRCCIVILRYNQTGLKLLMASWHGKHKAKQACKSNDFRILQHLISAVQASHGCHAAVVGGNFNYARASARNDLYLNDFLMLEGICQDQMTQDSRNKDDFFLWKGSANPQFAFTSPTANKVQTGSNTLVLDHFPVNAAFDFQVPAGAAQGAQNAAPAVPGGGGGQVPAHAAAGQTPRPATRVDQGDVHLLQRGHEPLVTYVISAAVKPPPGRVIETFSCPDKMKGRRKVIAALKERNATFVKHTTFTLVRPGADRKVITNEIKAIIKAAVDEVRHNIIA